MTISTVRHQPIFDPTKYSYLPITIVGAGATGSRVFMSLVELGLTNIVVYDDDIVEPHNLANQAYTHAHIGSPKVKALQLLYHAKCGQLPPHSMEFKQERVTDQQLEGMVFLLTDTMSSRREIIGNQSFDGVLRVFETRMASTHGNVYSFNPHLSAERDAWFNSLIDDDQAEVSPCGSPISVGPTASLIANLVVWEFMNYCLGNCHSGQIDAYFKPMMLCTKEALA